MLGPWYPRNPFTLYCHYYINTIGTRSAFNAFRPSSIPSTFSTLYTRYTLSILGAESPICARVPATSKAYDEWVAALTWSIA